jgi:hypothetical protein
LKINVDCYVNLEHKDAMKSGEQRIAIAKECGWKLDYPALDESDDSDILAWRDPNGNGPWGDGYLPDYPNDLNAMRRAEDTIEDDFKLFEDYGSRLVQIVLETGIDGVPATYSGVACVACASAAQRAEAFLKTKGLWIA